MGATRFAWVVLAACGGGGGQSPPDGSLVDMAPDDAVDAPMLENPGFATPTAVLRANVETSPDVWTDDGPADLDCLLTPSTDAPTTVTVALATTVRDFQSGNPIGGASVTVFPDEMVGSPFAGSPFTSNGSGGFSVNLPIGTRRFGFGITSADALPTFVLRQIAAPGQASQTTSIRSMSNATAQTLPALIGISRTPGTGLVVGVLTDCQGRHVSNFIATVSSASGSPVHVAGADTYYFSSSVGLPVRHSTRAASSEDGQFMVIELAPEGTAFVQVWGFRSNSDLANGILTLVAELPTPVIADTVLAPSLEPRRQ